MPILISITISGSSTGVVGLQNQLTLTAGYSDGTTADVTSSALWSLSGSFASINAAGQITGTSPGTVVVSASYNSFTTKFPYTVPALVSTQIVVPASVVSGQTAQFHLIKHYSDGSTVDVTSQATWFSSVPAIGTIDTTGKFTALTPGVGTVGAFQPGQPVESAQYTVLPVGVSSLAITAPQGSLAENSTLQLTATATLNDGSTRNVTSQVQWNAANPAAGVSSSGLVTGQVPGLAVIVANYQGVQGAITFNILSAIDTSLPAPFRSHLTQEVLNYFDASDVRVREQKYTIDAQLLNVVAQQLELSDTRFEREIGSMRLTQCPANIDNRGVYFQQALGPNFDFTVDHAVQGQLTSGGPLVTLNLYEDILPVPTRIDVDARFAPVALTNPVLFSVAGTGLAQGQTWATQRITDVTPALAGKLLFTLDAEGFNQIRVSVRITGQKAPQPAWAARRVVSSETLTLTQVGQAVSKFAWSVIEEIQISNLPAGATLSAQVGTFGLPRVLDLVRPYWDPINRDSSYRRYWTYEDGLLKEEYLASNYQGFRYIQSYATAPVNGIAVEPNTYGMFVAQGTTLLYLDRREPLPSSLNATALTQEPYYGLDVSIDETQPGPLRYVILRPVQYANYAQATQYRYLVQTPQGSTYALTPDGVLAAYTASAGWRRGTPISLTIPLAQTGTYVITLQCVGPNNTMLFDSVPYPNFALAAQAQFDLSGIVPSIQGLSFDDRGRLWVWSGEFAFPLILHYDAYVLDEGTQSIYLTDSVQGLVIDGAAV